ncbi:MAG: CARDB domain-containing protein, partial [Bacteroidales bacterium]
MKKYIYIIFLVVCKSFVFSQTYTVPYSGTNSVTTCSGTVYDHAGTSQYSNGADGTLTIYPQTAGSYISLSFSSFSTESGFDYLYIYDGTSTSASLLGSWCGTNNPGNVYATNTSGALTLRFYSDGSGVYDGFAATISCVTSASQADLIIQTPSVNTTSIVAGNSTSASFTLKNQGVVTASSNYTGFYLSTNNVWDASDTYLGSYSASSLGAGQTHTYYPTITIPSSVSIGSYYILFYADYSKVINEGNENNNVSAVPIMVVAPAVDLYVNNTSVSNNTLSAGSAFSAYGYVYNQGNITAPSSSLGFYLSTDLVFDASDVYLSSTNTGTISVGSYYYASTSLTIPTGTASGNYYILYVADYPKAITELNENNNINAVGITVSASGGNDLSVIISTATPSTVASGSSLSVSFTALNQSYQSISTSLGVYLSTDSILDASDTYLSYYSTGSISAHNFYSSSTSVTIPSSTTSGRYYIISYIDYTNIINETNEINNIYATPITVAPPVIDLLIQSPVVSPTTTTPGASVSVNCYIYNSGTTNSPSSNVGFYLSIDTIFDASDVYLGSYSGGTLSAGASSSRNTSVTIPSGTTPENYYVLYYADYTNQVVESNETNNVKYLAITVAASYIDLTITIPSNPANASAGNSINVSCNIYNSGNSSATYSSVGFYLSTDSIFNASDVYLGSYSGGTLAAGASSSRNTSVTIPSGTAFGNYYILYYADYTSQVVESNETNNVKYVAITIAPPYIDLTITSPGNPGSVVAGNSITASCYIFNNGTSSAAYSNVGFYLSTDSIFNASDVYLGSYSGGTLSAGASSSRNTSVTIPSGTTSGNYYMLYYADYANQVNESNETNNVKYIAITIASPFIDLTITSPSNPGSASAGNSINVLCNIYNSGNSSATYSSVGLYLSTDSIFDANDVYLGSYSGGTLSAGTSSSRNTSVTIPSGTAFGNYYIIYYADYANQVVESNETNNIKYIAIIIAPH